MIRVIGEEEWGRGILGQAFDVLMHEDREVADKARAAVKRYLSGLFPADQPPAEAVPSLAADLIPMEEPPREDATDRTPVVPLERPAAAELKAAAAAAKPRAATRPARRPR